MPLPSEMMASDVDWVAMWRKTGSQGRGAAERSPQTKKARLGGTAHTGLWCMRAPKLSRSQSPCRDMREKCSPEHRQLEVEGRQEVSLCQKDPVVGAEETVDIRLGSHCEAGATKLNIL